MSSVSKDETPGISDLRAAAVSTFVILNLAVFLIFLLSVCHYGGLFATTGGEPLAVYPIWKALHHRPVYEWPLAFPFSVGLYNYLFYNAYALFLRVMSAQDADIMTLGRLLTIAFAVLGAVAQWKLVEILLKLRGARSAMSLLFALSLWLSTSIARQWVLSVRTDIAATALVMIALFIVARQSRFASAYSGVFFYLAWSFKQSEVLAFVAVCFLLLLQRRWRDLSMLATVFVALTAVTLFVGTPEYRYNILVAPRLVAWSLTWAARIAPKTLAANAYWVLAPFTVLRAPRAVRAENTVRMLMIVFAVAMLGGLAGMTKVGAWDNYLLEAFAAGSTLLHLAVFTMPGRLVSTLVLFGCAQPAVQVATVPTGAHPHPFGTVGIATNAEYADAIAMRNIMAQLKKPIFTTDEFLSLPWFSADNRSSALVVDAKFHEATEGSCANGCVEGMLQRSEIPTVMLSKFDTVYLKNLSPNYEKVAEAPYSGKLWSIYVLNPLRSNPNPPEGP
jgi:hypothetical protein